MKPKQNFGEREMIMKSVLGKAASVISCVCAVLLLMIICAELRSSNGESISSSPSELSRLSVRENSSQNKFYDEEYTDMLESAVKTVVGISGSSRAGGRNAEYAGSGVIVSHDGYIITNQHVIGTRPERIEVTLSDGETVDATAVWSDAALDLAVLKISGKGYRFSPMGDARKLRIGESVTAIGNPLSLRFERSVTAGIVSALGRSIEMEDENRNTYYMEDLIQTDASINPGNSGGPLLNNRGEVVGINTVKVTNAEGMGFAVPVNICVPVIEHLRKNGKFSTPYLGAYAYTETAARYLKKTMNTQNGLFVAGLDTEGPAFKAGIRYGDVIVSVNGTKVKSMLELRQELYQYQKGEKITVEYIRNNKLKKAAVILDKQP